MIFSIKEWRKIYDMIQHLGQTLRNSRPSYGEDGEVYEPVLDLTIDEQHVLERKIRTLLHRNNAYLDQCGMKMPKPLWQYDIKKPETHFSSPEFKYGHLLQEAV